MSVETKPSVLIVYHTYTKQSDRVADAIAEELEARGCEVTKAMIEFTDKRWGAKLFSQFPLKHPISQISSMLTAQLRHQTGEIRVPAESEAGDYDLVVIASPTWWIQTCMPIRSYLESPAARVILDGCAGRVWHSGGRASDSPCESIEIASDSPERQSFVASRAVAFTCLG